VLNFVFDFGLVDLVPQGAEEILMEGQLLAVFAPSHKTPTLGELFFIDQGIVS
jgi:hypothetical protein